VVVLSTWALAAACSGGPDKTDQTLKSTAPAQPVSYFKVDPATAGAVHGTITYSGPKPTQTIVAMDAEDACVKLHGGKPVYDDSLVVGPKGGVANAFVYMKSGLEGKKFEPSKTPVVLDQRGCMFTPRVLGLEAGEPLAVRNSDPFEHNVHPAPKNNREWNEGMTPGQPDVLHKFAREEVMIRVKCNVHPWMRAWIGVVEHPYFAITGPDGAFDLRNVPPGDYTVAVWHEKLGEQTQQIHLGASSTQPVSFTFK
jgi:plastocyanin